MASPSTTKKPSRFGLFLPFVLLLLAIGGWSAWWYIAAGRINQGVDTWIAEKAADGAEFTYAARSFGGYPFRFELAFDKPAYKGAAGEASWEGDRAEFVMQAWNLKHLIGRVPGHNVITGTNGIRNSIDLGGEAAFSLSWNDAGLNRFGLQTGEAEALIGGAPYKVSNLSLNLAPRAEAPENLMMALQWDKVVLDEAPADQPYLGAEIGPSRLIGEVRGFFPAYERAERELSGTWAELVANGGGLEVAQLLFDWGPMDLGAKADLDFAAGRGNGTIQVRLDDADALQAAMTASGHWTQREQILIGTLGPASRNDGFLTLSVIDNNIFAGPVAVGRLPGTGS